MNRSAYQALVKWQQQEPHLPLLVRGARQVGKSYLIQTLGQNFEHFLEINFELEPKFKACFTELDPFKIVQHITLLTGTEIKAGSTLLFLDEIQECPQAIQALRYFKEKMPALHVIAAGSLLEFTLNQESFRMPVGRVQSLYLHPFTFKEFLEAMNQVPLKKFLEQITLQESIPENIHLHLLALLKQYMILGGMPAVLAQFVEHHNYLQAQQHQTILLNNYRQDFAKYHTKISLKTLQITYDKAPRLVAEQVRYVNISREIQSRDLKIALDALEQADLIHRVYATAAQGLPLKHSENEKKFKLLFVDIGLVMRHSEIAAEVLLNEELLLLNRGAIAEQFVGQELIAANDQFNDIKLHFWSRDKLNSQAEVDYVILLGKDIIPIEVKAGKTGRLRSLQIFMEEHHSQFGIQLSTQPLHRDKNLFKIPLYLTSELSRLFK